MISDSIYGSITSRMNEFTRMCQPLAVPIPHALMAIRDLIPIVGKNCLRWCRNPGIEYWPGVSDDAVDAFNRMQEDKLIAYIDFDPDIYMVRWGKCLKARYSTITDLKNMGSKKMTSISRKEPVWCAVAVIQFPPELLSAIKSGNVSGYN